ncbi:flavodoxin family protein [Citricoccus muralis]|uniref:Multimeric flavodoxin WrbA n=1 Tax=Citricoccus muralis TaxID=169134 RepID=A0A3D9LE48_9MICC|nr:NAD(P)H-dependent oxidoreductase [Citricoccus muralis]REE04495.1 multimeric flavodoxin WrbA [Citricoccus muralis]
MTDSTADTASTSTRDLTALALVCTLTPSPKPSSSELMARHVLGELEKNGVATSSVRVVDHDVKPGVQVDMGPGDAWPALHQQVLDADILVLATPIWMGHPCSIAQRVIERLDADLSETDDQGRPIMYDKTAIVAVVGNEDGAHKTIADMTQALSDIGFSIPAQAGTYWVGEAMQTVDYQDLDQVPENVASTTAGAARNAAHLARLLRAEPYPAGS